jgi:hypothetical protein
MAKPILIVKFPNTYPLQFGEVVANQLHTNEDLANDYHIFALPNVSDEFDFKVFNGEYTEIEYKKLENLINELKK